MYAPCSGDIIISEVCTSIQMPCGTLAPLPGCDHFGASIRRSSLRCDLRLPSGTPSRGVVGFGLPNLEGFTEGSQGSSPAKPLDPRPPNYSCTPEVVPEPNQQFIPHP